ncbi:winged helix-turn-helix domain-containing protein [Micromonospora sp. SL1-18]|uniref:winged helix-turn-helix domain-containing protein n=1 Tax=Micromonospora sp. SL1-18 TaxID=3399128 RepID=UPI003A4E634A
MIQFPPTYREIAAKLADEIRAGEWKPGDRLPSASDLASEHGVSPATAMRALRLLQEQGLAIGRQGRGFLVQGS